MGETTVNCNSLYRDTEIASKIMDQPFDEEKILGEITFHASRSGGKGGQNVNKVSSKVELNFDIMNSEILNSEQKSILVSKLSSKINAEGILKIVSQEERTQLLNKKKVVEKFISLLQKSFIKKKRRIPTKAPDSVAEERLKEKKKTSEKKINRYKNF